jgi:hypothetical protein
MERRKRKERERGEYIYVREYIKNIHVPKIFLKLVQLVSK